MKYNRLELNNNKILGFVILGAIVFFLLILPIIDNNNKKETDKIKEGLINTPEIKQLDKNICSKQCCKHVQWPPPHATITKEIIDKDLKKKYIGTNFSCNSGSGSGCLCMTKDDFSYLANRGSNAGKNMCGYGN